MNDSALSRALARIDELEAENASLRGAVIVKPNERLVIIAPEHVSENGLLQIFDGFYRRYVGQVIILAHDWRTIPIDDLRKAIEISMPVARTEQAQESTDASFVIEPYHEPIKAQEGQSVLAHGRKCVGVDIEPNYASIVSDRLRGAS